MPGVLVLGAGLVSRPLVRHLLETPGVHVTVASQEFGVVAALLEDHPRGRMTSFAADDRSRLSRLVEEHDLVVSLLPAPLHPRVARECVRHRRHLVTASYVSSDMRALDADARAAGVLLLNELGLDPGIDHMSAMRIIDDARARGGRVTSFRSYCGGLPAPEANDNPWGYKFSWSPRGVCTASKNEARWREGGRTVEVPGPALARSHTVDVPGIGPLEAYPNRDSLEYCDVYGLADVDTLFRGTLRYPGWCRTMTAAYDLGLLDEAPATYPAGTTFARWIGGILGVGAADARDLPAAVTKNLGLPADDEILQRFDWLGLFSADELPTTAVPTTPLDVLARRMQQKLAYRPGERDMVVLRHELLVQYADAGVQSVTSTLIDYGEPDGDSAMARTVGLPAAVAALMVLNGQVAFTGVQIPVKPEIYGPVLAALEAMGVRCVEEVRLAD